MPTNYADNAAAVAAGWVRTQLDRGASFSGGRFMSRYSKQMAGQPGAGGGQQVQEAVSDVSQADADTKALAALNGWRNTRYGFAAAGGSLSPNSGGALTVDVH